MKKITTIAFSVIILFFSFIMFFAYSDNPNYKIYRVASGSMSGKLEKGDFVFIKNEVDVEKIKEFDILVFKRGENLIIHFFKKWDESGKLIMQHYESGVLVEDSDKVKESDLVGKYIFKIPETFLFSLILIFINLIFASEHHNKLTKQIEYLIDNLIKRPSELDLEELYKDAYWNK